MASAGRRGRWWLLTGLVLLLLSFAPLGSAFLASWISQIQGCSLIEGGASDCVIGGSNWGPTLYNMFVAGWLMLFSIWLLPVALVLLLIGAVRWLRSGGGPSRPAAPDAMIDTAVGGSSA